MATTTAAASRTVAPLAEIEGLVVPKRGFPIGKIIQRILFWALIVFILFSRQIIGGIMEGAIKS